MSESHHRPHAAHSNRESVGAAETFPPDQLPSRLLKIDTEHVREMLEELDDAVFAALKGSGDALDQIHTLWPRAVAELDHELIEESREHYLRFALEVSRHLEKHAHRPPEGAVIALEVIALLTKI